MTVSFKPIALVFLLALAAPMPATAAPPALQRLEVSLMPEYDRPAVLVILRGMIAPGVELPAKVALPMPASVERPHAVAMRLPNGRLVLAPHERRVEGADAWIEVTAAQREVRLEYYAPLKTDEKLRRFTVTWPGRFPVGQLVFEVQEPMGATELVLKPKATQRGRGPLGLTVHRVDLGVAKPGASTNLEVSYRKADTRLTIAAIKAVHEAKQRRTMAATGPRQRRGIAPLARTPRHPPAPPAAFRWDATRIALLVGVIVGLIIVTWVAIVRVRPRKERAGEDAPAAPGEASSDEDEDQRG